MVSAYHGAAVPWAIQENAAGAHKRKIRCQRSRPVILSNSDDYVLKVRA